MLRIRSHAALTLALLGQALGAAEPGLAVERTALAMGTTFSLRLEGGGAEAAEAALREVDRIEAAISTWRPESVFSQVNGAGPEGRVLDAEWWDLLVAVQEQARRTGFAFDPVMGTLLKAWGVRNGGRTPSPSELRAARHRAGAAHLRLDLATRTVRLEPLGAEVEEGGFGKGYALDRALAAVKGRGAASGLLDFGGQLLAFGAPVQVSLADPGDRSRARLSLKLQGASLSTSGTSERGRHLLDPRTGRPCPAWGSVAVVAPTAFEADCLSTALYVMGHRRGLQWAAAHRVAACFLFAHGRIAQSPAFHDLNPTLP